MHARPAWAATAGQGEAYVRGLRAVLGVGGYVLFAGSVGFGALIRDLGLGVGFAIWSSVVLYALPAQVIMATALAGNASLIAAAFAVSLTSIRLLPMTVTLTPLLRDNRGRHWREVMAVHLVTITSWIEGNRRLGPLPPAIRLSHFLGFGSGFMAFTAIGAAVGFAIAGSMPVALTAALLFFTPSYFTLSMLATARVPADRLAVALGFVIGPLVYRFAPDLDLVVAGIVGGTIAYRAGRRR